MNEPTTTPVEMETGRDRIKLPRPLMETIDHIQTERRRVNAQYDEKLQLALAGFMATLSDAERAKKWVLDGDELVLPTNPT